MKHSLSRTLPGFKTRVRYEFNRLESNCTWPRPYQLAPAFREAERVQPGHRNALFNQGIVLYYDLKRKDEAEAAWRKLLAADPNAHAPDGTPVSELIKHLH